MKWLCRLFGHDWHYQPRWLSEVWGERPARTCVRCLRVERLHFYSNRTQAWEAWDLETPGLGDFERALKGE